MKSYVEKKVSGVFDSLVFSSCTGVTSSNSRTSDDNTTSDKSADKMAYLRWRPQ